MRMFLVCQERIAFILIVAMFLWGCVVSLPLTLKRNRISPKVASNKYGVNVRFGYC